MASYNFWFRSQLQRIYARNPQKISVQLNVVRVYVIQYSASSRKRKFSLLSKVNFENYSFDGNRLKACWGVCAWEKLRGYMIQKRLVGYSKGKCYSTMETRINNWAKLWCLVLWVSNSGLFLTCEWYLHCFLGLGFSRWPQKEISETQDK